MLRLLQTRTGLNFKYYRRNFIEKRIMSRMIRVKCKTLDEYYKYLFSREQEFRNFIESFNINYTFFFRDWEVYEIFQQLVLLCLNYNNEKILSNIKPTPSQLAKFRTKENYSKNKAKNRLNIIPDIKKAILPYLNLVSLNKKIQTGKLVNIWSCPCATGEEAYTLAMILDDLSKQIKNYG